MSTGQGNKTYRAAVITEAGGGFFLQHRPIPDPGDDQVLIKVAACGICHSDKFVKHGIYPGLKYPRVPGHEVVGTVVQVGARCQWPPVGLYVGVGWHGSHCLFCQHCRKGDFMMCPNSQVTGIHQDGGYQEYLLAHWTGVVQLPEGLPPVDAAPLLCAGVTMFNGIRNQSNLSPGDLVAIQGIGGLGHVGLQFANKMGYKVAAISSSNRKKKMALEQLGAHHYINTSEKPASEQLQALGGAALIVTTAPDAKAMADMVGGLASNGRLLVVGADAKTFELSPFQLIPGRTHVCGWSSGTAEDSADTCQFAHLHGVKSMNEVYPLEQVQEAYDRMESGSPRFRVVIKMRDDNEKDHM